AKTLLNPKVDESVFQRLAKQAIANAASRGELAKQICTATDSEFFELTAQANALGWMVDERGGAPFPGLSDPTLLIEIVGKNIKCPKDRKQKANLLNELQGKMMPPPSKPPDPQKDLLTPDAAKQTLLTMKSAAVNKLINLLPRDARGRHLNQLQRLALQG